MYMDDIKLYGTNSKQITQLLQLTDVFSKDICMSFGLDKCKTLSIHRGKLESKEFETQEGGIITPMEEGESYKYLGILQAYKLKHKDVKCMLTDTYTKRVTQILKSGLNGKNMFKAINTYAIPTLTYTFGILKWTKTDLENIQIKTRVLLTKYRCHHPRSAIERVILPRQKGGRGLIDLTRLHTKEITRLQKYFVRTKASSKLHQSVVKADNSYTPLDLLHATEANTITDTEYTKLIIRQWSQKALHGRHSLELSQQHVDLIASNSWLTHADMFTETEGFMLAIQDQVIATMNYRKYILKEAGVSDLCRKCGATSETIQHITSGCKILAPTEYLARHDQVAKIIHQKLATQLTLKTDVTPFYKYEPDSVLENDNHKLYWNRSILTDKTIPHNRPDITLTDTTTKTTFLIDIAVPNTHNLQKTCTEKINKYQNLATEIQNMWKQTSVQVLPIVISDTGVIPKSLHTSIQKLNLPPSIYIQLQKSIILGTCAIVRKFLSTTM